MTGAAALRMVTDQDAQLSARIYAAIWAVAFIAYAIFAVRASQGELYRDWNLLFDLDVGRFAQALARDASEWTANTQANDVKHPYISLLRILTAPLRLLGVPWPVAAALLAASAGAGAVVCAVGFLRTLRVAPLDAGLLGLFFALSSAQLFNAMLAESYVFSAFGLAFAWLLAVRRLNAPARHNRLALAPPVFLFGITVTNVVQAVIAEAIVRFRPDALRPFLVSMIRFGLVAGGIVAALIVLANPSVIAHVLRDPVQALKDVYWAQTEGPVEGPLQVARVFFDYTMVAPHFTEVTLDGGSRMIDFRDFKYSLHGLAALVLWQLMLAAGIWSVLRRNALPWRLAVGLGLALAFNFLFHLDFQYRGSIFLYATHWHFALFAIAAASALGARSLGARALTGWRIGLTALIVLALSNNIPRAWQAATGFDLPEETSLD